jgi:hypothetical protein
MPSKVAAHSATKASLQKRITSLEAQLTTGLHETDSNFYPGSNMSSLYRDRYDYDRQTILAECLRAWRVNPIARRIVKLISMFVVGEGISIKSDHQATQTYLHSWWDHPLNRLKRKCISFCDEATRSGNLFFLCTPDKDTGMLYVRAVPADQVDEIVTSPNDIDQELAYKPVAQGKSPWPAYDRTNHQTTFMLHYAYNQPVGVAWGEPDLAPMLPWIGRYSSWLEDRARLNRFRFAWLIVWKKKWENDAAKKTKQKELAANPPPSGSWLLLDPDETVEMPSPNLASADAAQDGLALKKMIAIGAGFPPHYLAEPESSTRTTAEAAGTPTFRGLEQTQIFFLDILAEIATLAVQYRHKYDQQVNLLSNIQAIGPDITERDNASLSLAVSRIYPAMSELFDRNGIDETELLRMVYRMAGEVLPTQDVPTMNRRPLKPASVQQPVAKSSPTSSEEGQDTSDKEPEEPKETP